MKYSPRHCSPVKRSHLFFPPGQFTPGALFISLLALCSLLLIACSDDAPSGTQETRVITHNNYTELGDLKKLKKRGQLRILTLPSRLNTEEQWLPREGATPDNEQEMARKLAESLGLEAVEVHVDTFDELIPALLAGKGDIIANNLTATETRKAQLAFTVPFSHSTEHIISRKNEKLTTAKLANREVAYKAGTSFEESIQRLQQKVPALKTTRLPGNLDEDEILDRLVNKQIDLAVLDSNRIHLIQTYRSDFNKGPAISDSRVIAWAVRPNNPALLEATNQFLIEQKLTERTQILSIADLDEIRKRKTLRVITRNNAANYFLWRGELLGFEYELIKKFAQQNKLRIEIITAPDHESLIPMLLQGKGDIIASFQTITEQRKQKNVLFSRPYHTAAEVIVSRSSEPVFSELSQLNGRRVHVRKSSAYWDTLEKLKQQGYTFELVAVDENMETEDIIQKVAQGKFDLSLADQHLLDIELTWRDDIQAAYVLDEIRDHGWVIRNNNPQLLKAVNQFIKKQYRQLFYNITYKKYFKNPHKIKKYRDERVDLDKQGKLSPYDTLVKKYAEKYQFDWRLLVAQMYQESRFDPRAKSWVGAKGLMQVMPRTAKELNISHLEKPENGIRAGVMYLDWVRDRFSAELDIKDRMWFTLAAYNAGQGHVKDARRLARQLGLNPDRWFDNVEKAMLLLSKRQYYSKARYGYVRGSEPVHYVRDIRNRYHAYISLIKQE